MITRMLRAALPAILGSTLGLPLAYADIYTWTDASGGVNVSNIPPPDGVRVTKILRAPPPEIVAREDAAREAALKAEAQALAERVRQLEDVARQMPPPDYRPLPAPPIIQYIVEAPAPPMQQIVELTQPAPAYSACEPGWASCGWWPGFFPASFIVVRAPNFRSARPIHGNNGVARPPGHFFGPLPGPNLAAQQPMRSFGAPQSLKRG